MPALPIPSTKTLSWVEHWLEGALARGSARKTTEKIAEKAAAGPLLASEGAQMAFDAVLPTESMRNAARWGSLHAAKQVQSTSSMRAAEIQGINDRVSHVSLPPTTPTRALPVTGPAQAQIPSMQEIQGISPVISAQLPDGSFKTYKSHAGLEKDMGKAVQVGWSWNGHFLSDEEIQHVTQDITDPTDMKKFLGSIWYALYTKAQGKSVLDLSLPGE